MNSSAMIKCLDEQMSTAYLDYLRSLVSIIARQASNEATIICCVHIDIRRHVVPVITAY